jgi:hypothetical protein
MIHIHIQLSLDGKGERSPRGIVAKIKSSIGVFFTKCGGMACADNSKRLLRTQPMDRQPRVHCTLSNTATAAVERNGVSQLSNLGLRRLVQTLPKVAAGRGLGTT